MLVEKCFFKYAFSFLDMFTPFCVYKHVFYLWKAGYFSCFFFLFSAFIHKKIKIILRPVFRVFAVCSSEGWSKYTTLIKLIFLMTLDSEKVKVQLKYDRFLLAEGFIWMATIIKLLFKMIQPIDHWHKSFRLQLVKSFLT